MINYDGHGDIFTSSYQSYVCPVNLQGVMGNGLALYVKLKYPDIYMAYKRQCFTGDLYKNGFMSWPIKNDKKIICVPTKRYVYLDSDYVLIDHCLSLLAQRYKDHGITSIAIPHIGCGKGRLDWGSVKPLIYQHLDPIEIPVGIFQKDMT